MPKVSALSSVWLDHYPQLGLTIPGGNSLAFASAMSRYSDFDVTLLGLICDNGYYTEEIMAEISKRRITNLVYIDMNSFHDTGHNTVHLRENGAHYTIPGKFRAGACAAYHATESKEINALKDSDIIHIPFGIPMYNDIMYKYRHDNISVDFGKMHDFHILELNSYSKYIFINGETDTEDVLSYAENFIDTSNYFVVQLGTKGSIVYYGRKQYIRNAEFVPHVVDTNGCNECYQAGFLAKLLETGDIDAAMAEGAKLYAECSQVIGALLPCLEK